MTIVTVIFSLLFLGLGVGMVFWARSTRRKAQASQAWPTAAGAVISSEVKVERNTSSMDGEMQETVSYRPVVSYRYAVGGVEHIGSRIAFGPASYTKGSAETIAEMYPAGASVSVFYNPEKPEDAVLERKAGGSTLLTIGGIVFLLVGVSLSCLTVILLLGGAPS